MGRLTGPFTRPMGQRCGMLVVLILLMLLVPAPASVNQSVTPVVDSSTGFTHYPEYDDMIARHIDGEVLYAQVPPVGGPHHATWQNCGFYTEPIYNWHGVHTLEHGAVWITYDPALPQSDIALLQPLVELGHVLVSPYPGLTDPVVASAWGRQVRLDSAADPRLEQFVREFRLNPETSPEPGALCTLGTDSTMAPGTTPQIEPAVISGTPEEVAAAEAPQGNSQGATATAPASIRDAVEDRD
ncbi:MAG TPA: DUF3105 domain-containing protein [Thermomicrobiales bacterium]|nr:DUF3105 domain-containing protein [Thermomicrobiales bacterium]